MTGPLGGALAAGTWLVLGAPARAADPGRLDLLAAEAARLTAAQGPAHTSPVPWILITTLLAGTMLAAFLGTYAGARRQLLRGGNDWRELTYRFRSGRPLRLKQDAVARLSALLSDLEGAGTDRERASEPTFAPVPGGDAPAAEPPTEAPAAASNRGDHRRAYERTRRVLGTGYDTAAGRERPGTAEPDPLDVVPAGTPR